MHIKNVPIIVQASLCLLFQQELQGIGNQISAAGTSLTNVGMLVVRCHEGCSLPLADPAYPGYFAFASQVKRDLYTVGVGPR